MIKKVNIKFNLGARLLKNQSKNQGVSQAAGAWSKAQIKSGFLEH